MSLDLEHREYAPAEGRALLDRIVEGARSQPDVEAVALARSVPLGPVRMYADARPEGTVAATWEGEPPRANVVSSGYFDLLGIPLIRGRAFSPSDSEDAAAVVIVNQALADRWWPGEEPIGRRVEGERPAEVVGVVADARLEDPTRRPRPTLWYPTTQQYTGETTVMVRTRTDPRPLLPVLRAMVRAVDPELPVVSLELLDQIATDADRSRQLVPMVLAVLGSVCLGLAALGIYGVVAHAVAQRTREIGVRLAMGARPRAVVAMVVRQALSLAGVGLAAGLVLAVGAAYAMRSMLFGVSPLDPVSIGLGVTVVLATAATAGAVPALRASRVDPARALRTE
jgi:predicted permease